MHPRPSPCRHCGAGNVHRRLLCWKCYHDPAALAKFPAYGKRPTPRGADPLRPTRAGAGSDAKIAVMADRAAVGADLFQPGDFAEVDHEAAMRAVYRPARPPGAN